jgi:hypothetical protein
MIGVTGAKAGPFEKNDFNGDEKPLCLGKYFSDRFEDKRKEYHSTSQLARGVKDNKEKFIQFAVVFLDQIVCANVSIAVVPSGKIDNFNEHGITRVANLLTTRKDRIDATTCLRRTKTIDELKKGGNRTKAVHEESIEVIHREFIVGKEVLLLDDVCTTGNSLSVCRKKLCEAGAAVVGCLALGKGYDPKLNNEAEFNFSARYLLHEFVEFYAHNIECANAFHDENGYFPFNTIGGLALDIELSSFLKEVRVDFVRDKNSKLAPDSPLRSRLKEEATEMGVRTNINDDYVWTERDLYKRSLIDDDKAIQKETAGASISAPGSMPIVKQVLLPRLSVISARSQADRLSPPKPSVPINPEVSQCLIETPILPRFS